MTQYQLVANIRDTSVRNAVVKALERDNQFSKADIRAILRAALDGNVTQTEYNDLQRIMRDAKGLDFESKQMIENFLNEHYRPKAKAVSQPAGQLTANFNIAEFACHDGTAVPEKYVANVRKLASNLQVLRENVGASIKINSSYRTPSNNKSIGGAKNSQHLTASAADIVISGLSPIGVKNLLEALISKGKMTQGGIGLYNSFVHYDIRGNKARWNG